MNEPMMTLRKSPDGRSRRAFAWAVDELPTTGADGLPAAAIAAAWALLRRVIPAR